MPYKDYRKYKYRKKGYYNKYGKKRDNIFYRRLKNKGYHMAKKALSMLNVEYKQHNLSNSTAVSNALANHQITNIGQGDTTFTRDGSKIKITEIYVNGFATIHALSSHTIIRLLLILDKQTNQAGFVATDFLLNDDVVSPLNIDNNHRFQILASKYITLSQSNSIKKFTMFRRINEGIHIRFDNATAAISSLTQNSLAFSYISNEPTNTPTIDYQIRLRYVDN